MALKKDTNNKEKAWRDYLQSIEKKPQKTAKKGGSIGQTFKSLLKKVGIGKPKKIKGEEIKRQIEISAKEAKKRPVAERQVEKIAVEEMPKITSKPVEEKIPAAEHLKGIAEQIKAKKTPPAERKFLKREIEKKPVEEKLGEKIPEKGIPSRMEKYITKIEEKEKTEKERKEFEELEKQLEEKKRIEEKKREFVEKPEKDILKKSLLAKLKEGKKKLGISKKISFMPKAEKGKKAKAIPTKKRRQKELISDKVIAAFFKPEPSFAKKSIEEIKKLSPTQIKKEIKKERIEKRARGWYGNSLKHKKAAISGWMIRKKVKLHQLKKKEKTGTLTKKEEKTKKRLIYEDKELRLKIQELDQKIKSLKKIAVKKDKENKILEKKIKKVGMKIPKEEARAIEKEKGISEKKEDMQQVVQVMKKIVDEIAATASRPTLAGEEKEGEMVIEDQIKAQEKLIQSLERAFYKRKVDFNQFREKMFDYQSKLTEMKIKKKIHEEKLAGMTPEMRQVMEKRIEARRKGTDVGLTKKTAEALEKLATKKEKTKLEEKTAEAIKKLAEKEIGRAVREEREKRFAEKTASALERIAGKLGRIQEKRPEAGARPAQPYPRGTAAAPPAQRAAAPRAGAAPAPRAAPVTEKGRKRGKVKKGAEVETAPQARAPRPAMGAAEGMPRPAAGFYEEEPVKKKGFLEKIKEKSALRQRPINPMIDKVIREKAAGASTAISKEQIDKVEQKLGKLLQKYDIPSEPVAAHIKTLDSNKLVYDFQKLINLIETKRESAAVEFIKPAPGFDIKTGVISKKKERIVGKEKEIKRARIETSFDKLLNFVKIKGMTNVADAAKKLGMTKKDVQECAEILERSRLIQLTYPPIGPVKLIYPAYLKWKLAEKKRKQEAKKKKKQ